MRYLFWFVLLLVLFLRIKANQTVYNEGQKLRITSTVVTEPSKSSFYQRFKTAGIIVVLPKENEIYYGDRVVVEGVFKDGELTDAKLISIQRSNNILFGIKKAILQIYKNNLPEPYASLTGGIVLGAKQNLPQELSNSLIKTGTTHVVVASGMNVALTAGFLLSFLLTFLNRKWATIASIWIIWVYTLSVGIEAPIVRAAIMTTTSFMAQLFGRMQITVRTCLITIFIMLFLKPDWVGDIGFQLSAGATLSLILFESKVSTLLSFIPKVIRGDLSTSIAAQIITAPIIFYYFERVSIIGPAINALVLWTVAPIMIIGFVGGLAGLIFPFVGGLLLLLIYPLAWFFVRVVTLF